MSYKDELEIRLDHKHNLRPSLDLFKEILKTMGFTYEATYTEDKFNEYKDILMEKLKNVQ